MRVVEITSEQLSYPRVGYVAGACFGLTFAAAALLKAATPFAAKTSALALSDQ